VLTLWGLADIGAAQTDTYVLSMSYDPSAVTPAQIAAGAFALASKDAASNWVNAVTLNAGGTTRFVLGAWNGSYGLGAFGVDTASHTVWAVINHASDFSATTVTAIAPTVVSPADGTVVLQSHTMLNWTGVAGATNYMVTLTGPNGYLATFNTSGTALTTPVLANGAYTWTVLAQGAGAPATSPTIAFTEDCTALRIAVMSDVHYFATNLLINNGVAFQTYLAQDRKLLAESAAIAKAAVDAVIAQNPDIVLVSGDLTKDGEQDSHVGFSNQLARLTASGAKVLVIPGNHDINNTNAAAYDGATTIPVPYVTPDQFRAIYAPFGYDQAIARDTNSLAYIVEPVSNLWVLCMDSCQYAPGQNPTAGSFDAQRLAWITNQLASAKAQAKVVIGMTHHGLMEHYTGQKTLFPEYVLDGYTNVAPLFASYGMKAVLTGHYHAQDIVKGTFGGKDLYDIETGSTVTYPCPYRIMDLQPDGQLVIASHRITAIDYNLGSAPDFQTYAYNYLHNGMLALSSWMLQAPPYNLPAVVANALAPAVTEAMEDHYIGDEPGLAGTSPATQATVANLMAGDAQSRMLGGAIWSMLTDLPPADNNLTMDLSVVSLVEPANAAVVTEGQTVTLVASANWDVTNVDFYANGVLVGSETARPYTFSVTAPTGTYVLTAVAWDNFGQASTSAAVTVTVRPQGPTVDIKVNGSDGPVTLTTNDVLSASIRLAPGTYAGQTEDWWVLAHDVTRDVWYQYVAPFTTTSWRSPWTGGTSMQAALFWLPYHEVLHVNGMAPGQYDLYFGVDLTRNGTMDFATLYYDSVSVTVTP